MFERLIRQRAHRRLARAGADPRLLSWLDAPRPSARGRALEEVRFVVFDAETTGLDPAQDRLLSLSAVGVRGGAVDLSDQLEVFVERRTVGGAPAAEIHGLITGDLFGGIDEAEAVLRFLAFVGADVLVAHHAGFDTQVITAALARLDAPALDNATVDTGHLARRLDHGPISGAMDKVLSLDELSARFGFEAEARHSAGGDALVTAYCFLALLAKARSRGIVTLDELLAR